MEANGRHAGSGGTDNTSEDNVVRLPREWLGPREELVPIAVDDEPVDHLATPPSTQDFWGEALGDGWTTPADEAAGAPRRHPVWRRRVSHARPGAAPARRVRPSTGIAVSVLLMVIGVAVSVAGQRGDPAQSVRSSRAVAPVRTTTVLAGTGLPSTLSVGRLHARPSALRTRSSAQRTVSSAQRTRSSPRRSPPTGRAHRPVKSHPVRHARQRIPTITIEPVRYTAPTPTAPSSSTSAAPPVTTPVTPPAAAATRTSAGSHQPATGASGALGPGSSPDG